MEKFDQPYQTGGTVLQSGLRKLFGQTRPEAGKGSTFLTQDQTSEFAAKSALEQQKQTGRQALQELKIQAQKEAIGSKIKATTQSLGRATSDYIYRRMGADPSGQPTLTYGEADRILRSESIDTSAFFKELGIDVLLGKNIVGEVDPQTRATVQGKLAGRRSNPLLGTQGSAKRSEFIQKVMEKGYSQEEAGKLADERGF